ncbi:hypothetical protein ACFLRF_02210 [Candidatus Altiarchaeota archaeon]
MKGQAPDYRVSTVMTDLETGKDRWTNIGVAFTGKECITVLMDAVPINGKLILQKPRPAKSEE